MSALPPIREMERAYRERDRSFDGVFFLAVRTTGIFCRPSCPARKPLSANVEFYPTIREALFAGYRPCLRCRPREADGRPPDWAARLLAEVEGDPASASRTPRCGGSASIPRGPAATSLPTTA
jgi:AraC family transcriptional regulator of adaptative response/methylated-DNA-[protein]-cysteine methyltransferase